MTDIEIRDALLRGDEEVTMKFFFTECKPLFYNIIRRTFSYDVDYDECINEFYIHIMENNGKRLRQFRGDRENSIFKWIMVVAIRYFIKNRNQVIDNNSKAPLNKKKDVELMCNTESSVDAKIDVTTLLEKLPNKRYALVIRRLVLEDAEPEVVAEELGISVANLYNLKRRALAAITLLTLDKTK
ncbi:MAG: sigma-70 family RNA polymerase sigma factor [Alistipes sp.]|nr:sigma-70 family RNA polymerase sigma factor [Alistipes sp.]